MTFSIHPYVRLLPHCDTFCNHRLSVIIRHHLISVSRNLMITSIVYFQLSKNASNASPTQQYIIRGSDVYLTGNVHCIQAIFFKYDRHFQCFQFPDTIQVVNCPRWQDGIRLHPFPCRCDQSHSKRHRPFCTQQPPSSRRSCS